MVNSVIRGLTRMISPTLTFTKSQSFLRKGDRMAQTSTSTSDLRVDSDGLRIFVRYWRPLGKARGVVTIVPGFNSHSGYYAWAAESLAARGLTVYALDLRGRGHSDGERFYVERFADYINDVSA